MIAACTTMSRSSSCRAVLWQSQRRATRHPAQQHPRVDVNVDPHCLHYSRSYHSWNSKEEKDEEQTRVTATQMQRMKHSSLPLVTMNRAAPLRILSFNPTARAPYSRGSSSYHTTAVVAKGPFSNTPPTERGVAIVLGLGAVSVGAFAVKSALTSYEEWKASQPEPPSAEEQEQAKQEAAAASDKDSQQQQQQQQPPNQAQDGKRENVFAKWFGASVGTKYYEGGFDDEMTRKEAALILGVRESSPAKRIKLAHRKLLVLNHPDAGGSTYMAGKINEAKELLIKGKSKL